MPGELDLVALLRDIKPEMQEGIFVFCTTVEDAEIPAAIHPLLTFREREGTTLVLRREEAESAGLSYQFASRLITLTVHPRSMRWDFLPPSPRDWPKPASR